MLKKNGSKLLVILSSFVVITGGIVYYSGHTSKAKDKNVTVNSSSKTKNNTRTVIHSDKPVYNDIQEITKLADAVFIGTVIDVAGTRNLARNPQNPDEEDQSVYIEGVDYNVKVEEFLKGNDNKDLLVTEERNVQLNKSDKPVKNEYYIGLENGQQYIFFANKSESTGRYYAVGEPFFFELKNNKVKVKSNDEEIRNLFKESDLSSFKEKVKSSK
ncbi:hypothetical protein [Gottfriedia solisilvae]|uniref:hypothetical protein n=1 Tax=Gottfriedia solisilvae TaxID=1516104 RepID=UPI003D2F2885